MDGEWEPPPSCSYLQQQYRGMQAPASQSAWNDIYHGGGQSAMDLSNFPGLVPNVGSSAHMLYENLFQPYPLQQQPLQFQPQPQPQPQLQPQPQPHLQPSRERSSGSEGSEKKPRGRPRKYAPRTEPPQQDGAIVPANVGAMVPANVGAIVPVNVGADVDSVGPATGSGQQPADPPFAKRPRGRPPGTGRRQQLGDQGKVVSHSAGTGLIPHMLVTSAGEDITAKMRLFSQQAGRSLCVLSVFGTLSNVTISQVASGGILTYKGFFDIISLSGSYTSPDVGGSQNQHFRLNICVSGPNGKILAGEVGGPLIAASPVQLVLLSFKYGEKKPQNKPMAPEEHATPVKAGALPEVGTPSSSLTQSIAHASPGSFPEQHQELDENNMP